MVFLTALLMAEPREFVDPVPQVEVRRLHPTGWSAPPGWYGFVPAAGAGIVKRAGGLSADDGLSALERLGSPDQESRSQAYDGRRLIRVDGGYLVLNYEKYRERDYGAAERTRRWRQRQRELSAVTRNGDGETPSRDTSREQKQKAEAEVERIKGTSSDFQPDSPPMVLAQHLAVKIRENNPNAKIPNLQKWAKAIDLMIRRDNREPVAIRAMIDWSQADDFWKANILSADKLREKFDVLTMQSQRGSNGNGRTDGRSTFASGTGPSEEAQRNPLGRFGMRDGAEWVRERDAAKRDVQKVQGPTS